MIEIDSVVRLLQGMGMSMNSRGESDPAKAMVGMFTYEASSTACLSCLLNYVHYLKRVGDDQKSGLLELTSLVVGLVGKGTRGPSRGSSGDGSGVVSELDHGSLSVGS